MWEERERERERDIFYDQWEDDFKAEKNKRFPKNCKIAMRSNATSGAEKN